MAIQLHTIIFTCVNEDAGRAFSFVHPYSFVSREAARRFADYAESRCWADGATVTPPAPLSAADIALAAAIASEADPF